MKREATKLLDTARKVAQEMADQKTEGFNLAVVILCCATAICIEMEQPSE